MGYIDLKEYEARKTKIVDEITGVKYLSKIFIYLIYYHHYTNIIFDKVNI